jgi:HlyD family secretion protein
MRRLLVALLVIVVVGGLSWVAYQATAQEKQPPPPDYEVYAVAKGDIASTVTSTGSIEPAAEVNLTFRATGPVATLGVLVGDTVTKDQVLASLQNDELVLAQQQASAGARLAQARLAQAQRRPEATEVAAAQAALESAQAGMAATESALKQLLTGSTEAQRRVAEANRERARVGLEAAQSAFDRIAGQPNASMMPQALQLQQATIEYEVAKASVESSLAPANASQKTQALAQIAQSRSAVAQAEANLDRLTRGVASEDLEILQVQAEQAHISIEQAKLAMKNGELIAPIDGVIGAVNIRLNEIPSLGQPAIILTDPSGFHIDLSVDEIDIGKLSTGQPVTVTIDALDGAQLAGKVSRIAPIAAGSSSLNPTNSGVVSYRVRVDIDPTDLPLRSGLTATVVVTTDEVRDSIVIPNRVIRVDRQTGSTFVEKMVDGVPQRTDIVIGLRNEQFSQVVSGIEAGDQLAVRRTDSGEALRQQFFGGG